MSQQMQTNATTNANKCHNTCNNKCKPLQQHMQTNATTNANKCRALSFVSQMHQTYVDLNAATYVHLIFLGTGPSRVVHIHIDIHMDKDTFMF